MNINFPNKHSVLNKNIGKVNYKCHKILVKKESLQTWKIQLWGTADREYSNPVLWHQDKRSNELYNYFNVLFDSKANDKQYLYKLVHYSFDESHSQWK